MKFAYAKPSEPAEPDPGPGWLRSRFCNWPLPRPGISACGRRGCLVCDVDRKLANGQFEERTSD